MEKARLDWGNLIFGYTKTDYNVRCYYRDGKWGELEVSSSENINLHIASVSLHYGQQAFEGLKIFEGKDGKARVFRLEENAKRMQLSSEGILMAKIPTDLFKKAVYKVVELNRKFIPPYGSGASLYARPLLIGSGGKLGIGPSDEFMFAIFVSPVGPYFKEGFKPVSLLLARNHDRTAPLGTGRYKVGGNYAASFIAMKEAKNKGFSNVLYLDALHKKYIDECGPANFFAIKKEENKIIYVTPKADKTILASITNKSLMKIAENLGYEVIRRELELEELDNFDEAGACGTAAVISPIWKIRDDENNKNYIFGTKEKAGEISTILYNKLLAIQTGDIKDEHNWVEFI